MSGEQPIRVDRNSCPHTWPDRVFAPYNRSQLRQQQNKQRQTINRHNNAVRKHNQDVKRVFSEVNRAINKFDRDVRSYNARIQINRRRIDREIATFRNQSRTTACTAYRTSVVTLNDAYVRLETEAGVDYPAAMAEHIVDLSSRETANSLAVSNALLGDAQSGEDADEDWNQSRIGDQLMSFSNDLQSRWVGALYALDPRNPDAARHFCTSAREIFVQLIDQSASDLDVVEAFPDDPLTQQGGPTRRSKIRYLLRERRMLTESFEDFVAKDVDNVLELFSVFNDGTHGSSGRFTRSKLASIKNRVEDGILFMMNIVASDAIH